MKVECDMIKDLLPLYIEHNTSDASNIEIEDHLENCELCRKVYEDMKAPDFKVQYDKTTAQSFKKFIKKRKRNYGMKVALITVVIIIAVFLIRLLLMGGLVKLLSFDSQRTEVYKDTDITHYQWYIGKNAKKEYADKWGMDESIFPESITDHMDVLDYKMVYYNPWDAQFLSYLVVEYDDKSYEEEIQRLGQYDSKEYKGYFGTRGFRDKYRLLAVEVDPDHGLIYALGEENNQIIYVELIFCNYFYDIDYQDEIDIQYLPIGFDATPDNEYRQKRLNR